MWSCAVILFREIYGRGVSTQQRRRLREVVEGLSFDSLIRNILWPHWFLHKQSFEIIDDIVI